MAKSTLTGNYQTTVPREVREELGIEPGDVLHWRVIGGQARVVPAKHPFLARRGSIKVGPGSTVEDVRRARRERGRESWPQLVERAAAGEEIDLAEEGRPVARLVPIDAPNAPRRPGAWKGQVWVAEDFDPPLPLDVAAGFGLDEENDDEL
jgi:antitoxin (DNA-binding transcriptional repressor) of toxin-antitoxin stability system